MTRILTVEDDALFSDSLARLLRMHGHDARCVRSLAEARRALASTRFEVVVLDLSLPDGRGIDLIKELRRRGSSPVLVCLTAAAELSSVVEAMRAGADDYIAKTETPDAVVAKITAHLTNAPSPPPLRQLRQVRQDGDERSALLDELVGAGPAMMGVRRLVSLASETHTTVLLSGETGTGKSHIARLIHRLSPRRALPFVTVDCAALSESLAESELFGHERGSFTGAIGRHIGAIESAGEGTLFFDEIADLPASVQGKLLRVLEERVIRRVGGGQEIPVRARVIGATRRDLACMVAERTFREDLFFRLTVLQIPLPPLRQRSEDVLSIAASMFERQGHPDVARALTHELRQTLVQHEFPGNIRELRNLTERIALMARLQGGMPSAVDIGLGQGCRVLPVYEAPHGVEQGAELGAEQEIGHALVASGGRIGEAAASLGMSRHALRRKLKKLRGDTDLQPTG